MNETKTHRIWGVMPEEKYALIEKWANELGIPISVYVAMAAWIGAKKLAEIHDLTLEKRETQEDDKKYIIPNLPIG